MKIINVSNRLPISLKKVDGNLKIIESSGGLVSALASINKTDADLYWVGVADFKNQHWHSIKENYYGEYNLVPLFFRESEYKKYYNGFSNSVLWPLFHYFPSFVEFESSDFVAYKAINQKIAEKVGSLIEEDDIVWIHDYHLLLLPEFIRKIKPDAKIGFFLHIPFPAYELIRILPKETRELLLEGILGADIIGFHTFDYCKHFLETIQIEKGINHQFFNILYKDRNITIQAFPISIDFDKFNRANLLPEVQAEKTRLKSLYESKKIIFSVDRLDYTKGVLYRLKGFRRFLEMNPEWKEKVIFILVLVPSRTEVGKYYERKRLIEIMVSQINGSLGNYKWNPVIYQFNALNHFELMGLYTGCDIALISPLRDGMNLVAKEFVASRNEKDGVLILSEMTGAAKELGEALLFNPLDENEIANKISIAINMALPEQKKRMEYMQNRIRMSDINHWTASFLDSIIHLKTKPKTQDFDSTNYSLMVSKFKASSQRLVLLDYDGTLAAFSPNPEEAIPTNEVLDVLKKLASNPKNCIAIVSGREKNILENWFGDKNLKLIAEHGAFIKDKDWQMAIKENLVWQKPVYQIMNQFVTMTEGSFIEQKEFSIAWHYRQSDLYTGYIKSRELIETLQLFILNSSARILDGNKVIEVKSAFVNKGNAVNNLFNLSEFDFCLAIGDDKTDEDMFDVVNAHYPFTYKVGKGVTNANFRFMDIGQVISFLHRLGYEN